MTMNIGIPGGFINDMIGAEELGLAIKIDKQGRRGEQLDDEQIARIGSALGNKIAGLRLDVLPPGRGSLDSPRTLNMLLSGTSALARVALRNHGIMEGRDEGEEPCEEEIEAMLGMKLGTLSRQKDFLARTITSERQRRTRPFRYMAQ